MAAPSDPRPVTQKASLIQLGAAIGVCVAIAWSLDASLQANIERVERRVQKAHGRDVERAAEVAEHRAYLESLIDGQARLDRALEQIRANIQTLMQKR